MWQLLKRGQRFWRVIENFIWLTAIDTPCYFGFVSYNISNSWVIFCCCQNWLFTPEESTFLRCRIRMPTWLCKHDVNKRKERPEFSLSITTNSSILKKVSRNCEFSLRNHADSNILKILPTNVLITKSRLFKYTENFLFYFLLVKFSVYLNRRVFVMRTRNCGWPYLILFIFPLQT